MKTFLRNIRRLPMAYALNIIGLSVAFAAFMVIMTEVADNVRFDRSTPDAERIFRVESLWGESFGNVYIPIVSRPEGHEIIGSSPLIETGTIICPFGKNNVYFTVEDQSGKHGYKEDFYSCSPEIVDVFKFDMIAGSDSSIFTPEKALIPESIANTLFGSSSNAIDKIMVLEESLWGCKFNQLIVGGVFKDFPNNTQMTNVIYFQLSDDSDLQSWGANNYYTYIKLKDAKDIDQVKENYIDNFVSKREKNGSEGIYEFTALPDIFYSDRASFDATSKHGKWSDTIILLSIGLLILLLAAINFTNFSMALVPLRIKSINTRKVLGSSNATLQMGLVNDAVYTSLVSFFIALGIFRLISTSFLSTIVTASLDFKGNIPLFAATMILAIIIGFLAGIYPSRYSTSFAPAMVLKGSFGLSRKGLLLRKILVSIQFVISISLITCALFIQKQNRFVNNAELGFDQERVAIVEVNSRVVRTKLPMIEERLKKIPEVEDVAFAQDKLCAGDTYSQNGCRVNGTKCSFTQLAVSWNFPRVIGMHVYEGRDFEKEDHNGDFSTIMFNKEAQQHYDLKLTDNYLNWSNNIINMVGFADNIKLYSLKLQMAPTAFSLPKYRDDIYFPYSYTYIRFNTGTDPTSVVKKIENVFLDIDPYYPFNIDFFDNIINIRYQADRQFEDAIKSFSILAILISMIGVFGLILFDTQQKKREIAIRRVHGASEREILGMFTRSYLIMICVCFVISIPIVFFTMKLWLSAFSERIKLDPWAFLAALGIIMLITVLTIAFQVLRAIRSNPVKSIGAE